MFLDGWKTYIAVLVLIGGGIAQLAGVIVPGFEHIDPGVMFTNALGLFGIRWKLERLAPS